jgi:hypothetical protein
VLDALATVDLSGGMALRFFERRNASAAPTAGSQIAARSVGDCPQ